MGRGIEGQHDACVFHFRWDWCKQWVQDAVRVYKQYECTSIPTYTSKKGTLFDSGGVLGQYSNNEAYSQVMKCAAGLKAYLRFTMLDIQYSVNCVSDSITLKNGGDGSVIYSSCGSTLWQGYPTSVEKCLWISPLMPPRLAKGSP